MSGGQRSFIKSFSVVGRNLVKTHNRVMSLVQMVVLEMLNKYVKFHKISFNNVQVMINLLKVSKCRKGHNFVNIYNRVMSLSQVVAYEMVNKCVKFHNISFNIVAARIKILKNL